MKRALALACATIGALLWLFPLFHVIPLEGVGGKQRQTALQAPAFARKFWAESLLPATERAVPINELIAALARDVNDARKRLGRSPGLASATYFFVKGSGTVASIEKEAVVVTIDGPAPPQQIELFTGFLFGNTVRDATGLSNASDFPNSQNFNDLSTELNRIIERDVIPQLHSQASVGKTLRFAGCMELDEGPTPARLLVIPVKTE